MIGQAKAYNRRLAEGKTAASGVLGDDSSENDKDYMGQLSVHGVMGYIEIPKISVDLPIRHGTSSAVLGSGVGHLYGTSLPVGGKSTNSMLAAHRGVPSAVLFTRLDELKKGDYFYIHVLGKTLAYKVDATWTVDPRRHQALQHHARQGLRDPADLHTLRREHAAPARAGNARAVERGDDAVGPWHLPGPVHSGPACCDRDDYRLRHRRSHGCRPGLFMRRMPGSVSLTVVLVSDSCRWCAWNLNR